MKNRTTPLLLFLILCFGNARAQFPSFPDSNAFWLMSAYDQQGLAWQSAHHMRSLNHDTLLNGTWYNSLWSGVEGQGGSFAGGVREDADHRVYYFHPNTNSEYLLYDLDPLVGETMVVWFGLPYLSDANLLQMHITSIDTIMNSNGTAYRSIGIINSDALISWQISNDTWIQGVGGSAGLFTTEGSNFANFLDCMQANDTLWPAGEPGICSPLSVQEQYRGGFVIHPNPSTGQFTLQFKDPIPAKSSFSVFDTTGRLLHQMPLPTGAMVQQVDLSRFGPGAYVLRVTDSEGQRHERVVVE